MSEENLLQHDSKKCKNPYRELSNPHGYIKSDTTLGWFKEDFSKDDVRLYYPMQLWCWIKGNDAWTRSKPIVGIHRDPRLWNQLSEDQKETFDILDTRNLGMPTQAMMAAGMHVSKRCDKENALYVLAKSEFLDPRSALRAGKTLSNCVEDSFNFILNRCPNSFKDFARSIENNDYTMDRSRYEQYLFDMCMHNNGQEKAMMSYRETIIKDEDVPWSRPKNPMNFRVHPVDLNKHSFDPLKTLDAVPNSDEFRDFVKRTAEEKARRAQLEVDIAAQQAALRNQKDL